MCSRVSSDNASGGHGGLPTRKKKGLAAAARRVTGRLRRLLGHEGADNAVEAKDAVAHFLTAMVGVTARLYPAWQKLLNDSLAECELSFDERRNLFEMHPVDDYFFAAVVALVPIQTNISAVLGKEWQVDILVQLRLFGGSLSAYVLGWLLGRLKRRLPNAALIAAAAADLALIAFATARYSAAAGRYNAMFQSQSGGLTVLLAACVFLLFKQNCNGDGALRRALAPLAELSLGVYLCHNILLSILDHSGVVGTRFLFTCGKAAAVAVCAAVLMKTLASVRPLCYCCTGLCFDEACRTCNWQHTFRRAVRRSRDPAA